MIVGKLFVNNINPSNLNVKGTTPKKPNMSIVNGTPGPSMNESMYLRAEIGDVPASHVRNFRGGGGNFSVSGAEALRVRNPLSTSTSFLKCTRYTPNQHDIGKIPMFNAKCIFK